MLFCRYEDAGSKDIWPISPTNHVTDLFATKMHEARAALPPTGHDWKGIGLCCFALRHGGCVTSRDRLLRARAIKLETSWAVQRGHDAACGVYCAHAARKCFGFS